MTTAISHLEFIRETRRNFDPKKDYPKILSFEAYFQKMASEGQSLEIPKDKRWKFSKKDIPFLAKHVSHRDEFIANVQKVTNLHFHKINPQVFRVDVGREEIFLSGKFFGEESALLRNTPTADSSGYTEEFSISLVDLPEKLVNQLKDLDSIFLQKNYRLPPPEMVDFLSLADAMQNPKIRPDRIQHATFYLNLETSVEKYFFAERVGAEKMKSILKERIQTLSKYNYESPPPRIQAKIDQIIGAQLPSKARIFFDRIKRLFA